MEHPPFKRNAIWFNTLFCYVKMQVRFNPATNMFDTYLGPYFIESRYIGG